ncbi:MAG: HPr family phosphocarrier protein [Monoglobaceae bacterium]
MKEFKYTITDETGIHARPAGLLVKEASRFLSSIEIETDKGKIADAKRLFALMSLAAAQGDTITVRISGSDEAEAEAAIRGFLQENL